jgi:arylsulfate sulfotransferase
MTRRIVFTVLIVALAAVFFVTVRFVLRPVKISLNLSEHAPLTALAGIETKEPTRISLTVRGRDGNDLTVSFDRLARDHQLPVLGLYPGYTNRIDFRITTADGQIYRRSRSVTTDPLPDEYPEVRIRRHLPGKIAPGMIFMHLAHYDADGNYHPLPSAVDPYGRVRWYYDGDIGHVLRRMENGRFLIQQDDNLAEIDMLGRTTGRSITVDSGIHHDASILPNGDFLVLTSAPGSFEDGLVEIDREGDGTIRSWDFRNILDPDRPRQPRNLEKEDWLHLNAVTYDPVRDDIVVSGRDQSAVVKIDRKSGTLKWILGNHRHWTAPFEPYLLEPQGEPFQWPWGQHAPMLHPENPDRLLVYDNGNKRSYTEPLTPADNYSRAVEYRVNPETMEVRQIWEYGRRFGSELYTPFIGDANYLPGGNRLVTFGGITRTLEGEPTEIFDWKNEKVKRMKISARIAEVTGEMPAREVLTLVFRDPDPDSYRGYRCYRAVKMSLYPQNPAEALAIEAQDPEAGR